tara:strand:+ start:4132 stop:4785 length:654 start_codon:yes stop_codon:yes gene_type:complete
MKPVKVSVLIPVYNAEPYIGRCIRSLLNQTLNSDDYELIVIDDGSTDNTEAIIQPYMGDIRYYKNKKNFGLPKTLNTGIKKSKGQFIVRVDADDWVHPEYLNTLSLALKLNDHLDAIACDYFIVSENQEKIKLKNCEKDPIGCGIMFKTQQLIKIGVYDEKFLAREEEDLAKRFKEKFKISRLPIPLYQYRFHGKNMTKNKKLMKKYKKKLKKKFGI